MIFLKNQNLKKLDTEDLIANVYSFRRGTGLVSFSEPILYSKGIIYTAYAYCFSLTDQNGNNVHGSYLAEENSLARKMGIINQFIINGRDVSSEGYYLVYCYMDKENSLSFSFGTEAEKSLMCSKNIQKGFFYVTYYNGQDKNAKIMATYGAMDYTVNVSDGCFSVCGENEANTLSIAAFSRYLEV